MLASELARTPAFPHDEASAWRASANACRRSRRKTLDTAGPRGHQQHGQSAELVVLVTVLGVEQPRLVQQPAVETGVRRRR